MTVSRFHGSDIDDLHRPYTAASDRYDTLDYRQVGTSGLYLPAVSLGCWHNFGDDVAMDRQRALLRGAFDRGITHFDLANNYGPPRGSAEKNVGRVLAEDFRPYRDELIIATKAGWDMQPGPYGEYSSRKYLISSAESSLRRLGLDYVDLFYSHRFDEVTPLEETIGALDQLIRQGKALYVGISSYSAERTAEASAIARSLGTPLVIHQPAYNMLNRWSEGGLFGALDTAGMGAIAFTPLAQGLLTSRYLKDGTSARSTAARGALVGEEVPDDTLASLRGLDAVARERGQSLAQLALQWVLRVPQVSSVLIGASRVEQLDENLGALEHPPLSDAELARIDALCAGVAVFNKWAVSAER